MNRFCKFLLAGILTGAAIIAAPVSQSHSQSVPEPAVVISIADISQQLADSDYLLKAAGYAEMKFFTQTMIKQYTKGVDAKRPAGVMLFFNEDSEIPDFLGFVPVSNLDDVLDTISGMAEVDEGDEFTTILTDDGTKLLIKQVGDTAFLANKEELFSDLPSNPAEALEGLPQKYNLAAQIFGQRIPQKLRDKAIAGIRDGYEKQLELLDEAEPAQAELQRSNFEYQMKQFEMWLNDTDNIIVGIGADSESESLFVDISITAVPGTDIAKRLAAAKPTEESLFKGFLIEGAAFNHQGSLRVSPEEAAEYKKMIGQAQESLLEMLHEEAELSDEDGQVVDKAIRELLEVIQETLENGILDSGAVVMLDASEINFAAGIQVADPQKTDGTFKDLIAFMEKKLAGEMQVELNSGNHKDITFHRLVIDVPDDEEQARDIFGDQLTVLIGVGSKAIYLAGGSNPLPLLKQAVDNAGPSGELPLMQYNVYLAPILRFAASIAGEPTLEKMAEELSANGKDRINMMSTLIENGMLTRFEMQDGILALIKVGFENMGNGGFPGGGPDDF